MEFTYPKLPEMIELKVTKIDISSGVRTKKEDETTTLAEKLDEYVVKLGLDNPTFLTTFICLLTRGKIRMDLRYYIERLELADPNDCLKKTAANDLLEDFLARKDDESLDSHPSTTQRIVIQPPKE